MQTALVLLVGIVLAQGASAQTTVEVTYTWTPPSTGSPVDVYIVEHSVNGGAFQQIGTTQTNTYTLTATVGDSHVIRVAGVDDESRVGPFSTPSDPYDPDAGPPGQPGQPILL